MPKANWGISASDVDEFDRDTIYAPYTGPTPVNGVYEWHIKVLKFIGKTGDKVPQLRVGLALAPRSDRKEELKYEDYFIMAFLYVTDKSAWKYVPFLDAIGVTGTEFVNSTVTDEEGNVKKIGKWRNTGEEFILAELKDGEDQNGNSRKEIGWMGPIVDDEETADDDDEDNEDDYFSEDED